MSAWTIVTLLLAFALGGILGGQLMGLLKGVDLRRSGSGNIGTTNALRTQGAVFALAVLVIDAGKGVLAARVLPLLMAAISGEPLPQWLPYASGALAVLGHCYSPWCGFNGGKGVATLAGVFLALLPVAFPWMLLAFVLVVLLTGIVSLATLAGGLVCFAYVLVLLAVGIASPPGAFTVAMVILVLWTHRENWQRLLEGTESRFERARMLGRVFRLPALGAAKAAN
jgi:glycerol-3-phosphate acyltransferase PlsY